MHSNKINQYKINTETVWRMLMGAIANRPTAECTCKLPHKYKLPNKACNAACNTCIRKLSSSTSSYKLLPSAACQSCQNVYLPWVCVYVCLGIYILCWYLCCFLISVILFSFMCTYVYKYVYSTVCVYITISIVLGITDKSIAGIEVNKPLGYFFMRLGKNVDSTPCSVPGCAYVCACVCVVRHSGTKMQHQPINNQSGKKYNIK